MRCSMLSKLSEISAKMVYQINQGIGSIFGYSFNQVRYCEAIRITIDLISYKLNIQSSPHHPRDQVT